FKALARANTQAPSIERSATTTAGGEFLLTNRVEYHCVLEAATVFARNAHGIVRHATDEVGGAIQRVDDPEVIGAVSGALREAAFLAENAVVGVGLAQRGHDQLFRGVVDLGDIILRVFLIYRDHVQALGGTKNQFAGAAGGAQRDIQHGLHRSNTWSFKESRQF